MASGICFIHTILIACLLANTETTTATRNLLQKIRLPPGITSGKLPSLSQGSLPPLSSMISAMSPRGGNLPFLSQGSLPPLSSIISAISPSGSSLPSLSQGSLPPLSGIISAMSPKTSTLPSFSKGSLPKLSGMPTTPATRNAAPSPPPATSPLSRRSSTIPKSPTGRFSLPILSPPPARTRP